MTDQTLEQEATRFEPAGNRVVRPQQTQSNNLERWLTQPPQGYRLTPSGYRTVTGDDPRGYVRPRGYYTPNLDINETVAQMKNAELLTPFESWVYEKLPPIMDTGFGRVLQKFNEGWAGKALQVLDVGAEALERTTGLAAQFIDASQRGDLGSFTNDLAAAWYAGGLAADMANLPTFNRDDEGKITGFSAPTDLPGIGGVVQARNRIKQYVAQGMDYGEALKQTRADYYDNIGALALRAQLYDTYFHILADPINIAMPYIKPVERLQSIRLAAMSRKFVPDSIDFLRAARVAEETAGNLDDAARIGARIAQLEETGQTLSLWDKAAIFITGGDPLEPNVLSRIPIIKGLTLSPEARAHEMMTVIVDNIDAHILSKFDDPEELVELIYRASKGALGPDFGHAFLTPQGRMAQSIMGGVDNKAKELFSTYQAIAEERYILDDIVRVLGEKPGELVQQFADDAADNIIQRLISSGDEGSALAATLTDDVVDRMKLLDGLPYTPQHFKYYLSNGIKDMAAKLAIAKFGVKERGFIQKLSYAVKSAETMAFLRLNPGFMTRNFINNEFTMIARGLGGIVTEKNIDDLIDILGFEPTRISQAFTIAGEPSLVGAKVSAAGESAIADALRGEAGALDRFSDWVQGIQLPKAADMGYWATRAEQSASRRAFYSGYMKGWNRYFWKPGKGYDRLSAFASEAILGDMSPDVVRAIENAVGRAKNTNQLDELIRVDNLNLNSRTIFDDIERELGVNVHDIYQAEDLQLIETRLSEALPKGKAAVRRAMTEIRETVAQHIEEAAATRHQARIDEIAAITQAEGPPGLLKVWGDAMDEHLGGRAIYTLRMEQIDPAALPSKVRNQFWDTLNAQNRSYWDRQWDRLSDVYEGTKQGFERLGATVPDEFTDSYRGFIKGWKDFYNRRDTLHRQYFTAIEEGRRPTRTWTEIQEELDDLYRKMDVRELDYTTTLDDAITNMVRDTNPELADAFSSWRAAMRDLRHQNRMRVVEFRESIKGLSPRGKSDAWREFWREQYDEIVKIWRSERAGVAMMQGDEVGAQAFQRMYPTAGYENEIRTLASRYNIPSATAEGIPLDRRLVDTVNKYLRGEYRLGEDLEEVTDFVQFNTLDEIPINVAEEAFEARRVFRGDPEVEIPVREPIEVDTIGDITPILNEYKAQTPPLDVGMDQHWFGRGFETLQEIEDRAILQIDQPALKFSDLTAEQAAEIERYIARVKGQMSDARLASVRFAEYARDSALLNYNRRYNYNNWLSVIFPFEFWTTQSIAKWAVHSIDRPAMLSSFLRLRKFQQTAGAPQNGFPSRLKNSFRVDMPFLPDWLANRFYVDPMRAALPFDTFASPFEQAQRDQRTIDGRATRLLMEWSQSGEVSTEDAERAISERSGAVWERAVAQAQVNDSENRSDAWDFANLVLSPHAPITWAVEALRGTPENIGPLVPISRTFKQAAGVLGIDVTGSRYNVFANIREGIGLPRYDKWDDYRVERMISNMVAMGEVSLEDAKLAMINQEGPIWDRASSRAAKEYAGGGAIPFLFKALGIPVQAYPEGEQQQRSLQDDFSRAYEAYDNGDPEALHDFFERYPEYETRLALWKEPEERMHQFLVDEIWSRYFELPSVNKRELKEAFGRDWETYFLDPETRNYESIPAETLQVWLKLMGGDPPGTLNSEPLPLSLTDEDQAWRVEQFYNLRAAMFPNYRDQQDVYFKLDTDARREYRSDNPELVDYWDWRRDFFHRNPDVVPFLDDNFEFEYDSPEEIPTTTPQYTFDEWSYIVGSRSTANVLASGQIPPGAEGYLQDIADDLGITLEDMIMMVAQSQE